MTSIYYKESTKNFPPIGHPLIPPLFIEAGKMPCSSQDKAKPCVILVNLAGIYFLRPEKLKKTYKVSKFLSSFLITEIIYDDKKRTINTKHDSIYLQCPHMDEAVSLLVSARKFLLQRIYEKSPVKFTDFPSPPIINNIRVDASLLTLQYICYCIQHDVIPDDLGIIPKFQKFDPNHHSIMSFDEFCSAPSHLNCLCGPIHFLDSITTLHFSNFAPYSACRIIHKIMRHQMRVRTFIIDGYQHLVPEQLRLKKLSPKGLISIVMQNCRLPEETMIKLFNELGEYQGEVQRLSLRNIELTDKSWKELLNVLTTCRAFRTIEIFELEKIEASQLYEDQLHDDILTISKHCRFIQRFSISLWAQPQLLSSIEPFFVNTFLFELVLQGQNITQPFSSSLKLPRPIHYLDFSGCNFTYISLKSLFAFLARTPDHNPITLNLADIMLPSAQWQQFYQDLSTVNHLNYIGELDWSGNAIDSLFIQDTVSFFFTMNPLKFLTIDRVFGNNKIDDFYNFFNSIPHGKLKGLSIGGSQEQNFSGNFEQLFKGISRVSPLNILHLVGQKMQPEDIQPLSTYLGEYSSSLCELLIDGTNLSSAVKFYEFYQSIFNLNIPIIGRPEIDLERFFGSKTFGGLNNGDELRKFREHIVQLPPAASKSARAYYFSRHHMQKDFDFNQYTSFVQRFPASFFDPDDLDEFQLQYKPQKASLPSLLFLMRGKKDIKSLSELHAACLVEPIKLPLYQVPPKFNNRTTTDSGFNDYDNQNNYNAMNQLSSFTNPNPLANQPDLSNQQQSINVNQDQLQQNQEIQQIQDNNNYDQQFVPDPNFLNQNYDQQFVPDPNFLNQNYDQQFSPDPYFYQNQQNPQFQPQQLEPLQPLEPQNQEQQQQQLEPLQPLEPQNQEQQQLEPLQPLEPENQAQKLTELEPLQPLDPQNQDQQIQLESLQPLSSDYLLRQNDLSNTNFGVDFISTPEYESQFTSTPEFMPQDQFQFDPQFQLESLQNDNNNNGMPTYDPNQEFSPQFIPDPDIDMMMNTIDNDPNHFQNEFHPVPPSNESQESNLEIAPPPELHNSNDQNIFIPPPPSFSPPPPPPENEPVPQQQETEPQQPSNDFVPAPIEQNEQPSNVFIPPPPENSLQLGIFIPPPPGQNQPQQEQQQVPPPPIQEVQPQQEQQSLIPPPVQEVQPQQEQLSVIPPSLLPDQPQLNAIPPSLQPDQPQLNAIPPPLQSSSIPPPLQSNQNQQLRSSLTPPPLQVSQLQPQAPAGFIPPPLAGSQLRSSLTPLMPNQINNTPSQLSSIPPPLQVAQVPSIPPPVQQQQQLEQEQREKEQREKEQREKEQREKEQREREQREKEQREKEQREREQREKEQREREQREKEQREKEQREKEQREKEQREREQREREEQIEAEQQFAKTQIVKNRAWNYTPNEPRRGPPVLVEKLTLVSKKTVKKNRFPSCAGLLDLPRLPPISRQSITAAHREVTIPESGKVPILTPTEIINEEPQQKFKPFSDIDIPDLITMKSITSTEKKREITVFDHSFEDSVTSFYEGKNDLPFQLLQTTPNSKIIGSEMSHPLQKRKRIEFPQVKILGVPSEW